MTFPLPYTVQDQPTQANFDAFKQAFPLSRKAMSIETPNSVGGAGQPAFLNSWVNFSAGWQVARFWRDPMGVVHLEGLVKSGTPGATSVVFTLPTGYRPSFDLTAATYSAAGVGRITVKSTGDVVVEVGSTTWTSLLIPPFKQEQ